MTEGKRALVTGATGMIGRALVHALGEAETVVVGRDRDRLARAFPRAKSVAWDGNSALDASALDGVDVVYHLAGEPVGEGRWSEEKKRRIAESRVNGTRGIVDAMAAAELRPRVLVCASAVGYYGSRGDELLDEESAQGEGFLAGVCGRWENEAAKARASGARVALVRIGVVFAREGGALGKMLPIFRTGLAGPLGDGKQWMPWLHRDDAVGLLRFAADTPEIDGPMNACAPAPVTNNDFTRTLAHVLHRPAFFRAPAAALRVLFGEMAAVVLASQRVTPARALAAGYAFRFDTLEGALRDVVAKAKAPVEVHA